MAVHFAPKADNSVDVPGACQARLSFRPALKPAPRVTRMPTVCFRPVPADRTVIRMAASDRDRKLELRHYQRVVPVEAARGKAVARDGDHSAGQVAHRSGSEASSQALAGSGGAQQTQGVLHHALRLLARELPIRFQSG